MTIDEAIEVLEGVRDIFKGDKPGRRFEAIQLGIEALKEIKHLHESQVLHDDELLPGETQE